LLNSLILKFVKNVKVNVVMRQHNIWCMYVRPVWRSMQTTPEIIDQIFFLIGLRTYQQHLVL